MPFNYQGALSSGASEDAVLKHLLYTRTRKFNVDEALKSGASKKDIIAYLSKDSVEEETKPGIKTPSTYEKVTGVVGAPGKAYSDFNTGVAKGALSTVVNAAGLGERAMNSFWKIVLPKAAEKKLGIENAPTLTGGGETSAKDLQSKIEGGLKIEKNSLTSGANTMQKVGAGVEQVAEFFIPGGAATKVAKVGEVAMAASKVAKGGGYLSKIVNGLSKIAPKAASEAVLAGGVATTQTGDVGTGVTAAGITAALIPGAKVVGGITKNIAKLVSSKLSDVPTAALEMAFKNPNQVQEGIQNAVRNGDVAPMTILEKAKDAVGALKEARRDAYKIGLEDVNKSIQITKTGANAGRIYVKDATGVFVPTKFSLKGLKDEVTKTLGDFNIDTARGNFGEEAFTRSALPNAMHKDIAEVVGRIYKWDDITPTGLDDLREIISSYRKSGAMASSADKKFNAIVESLRKNISTYTNERVPLIGKINKDYHEASDVIEGIEKNLNLSANAKPVTAMRTLMNIFSPKSPFYRDYITKFGEKKANELMGDVAGTLFARWLPEGTSGYLTTGGAGLAVGTNPWLLLAAPSASPRIVGEVITNASKILKNKTVEAGKKLLPQIRTATGGNVGKIINE